MENIKTFADACKALGLDPETALPYKTPTTEIEKGVNYFAKLSIIAAALNGDWVADFSDSNQDKYYPWFKHKAGSGLSFYDCALTLSSTRVGSRLCFKTYELAIYAGKQFEADYRNYFTAKS